MRTDVQLDSLLIFQDALQYNAQFTLARSSLGVWGVCRWIIR